MSLARYLKDLRIVNPTEFYLQMNMELIPGFSLYHKASYNDDIDQSAEKTIWNNGTDLYDFPTSADTITIFSDSNEDRVGESGAQQVSITYLDANFDVVGRVAGMDGDREVDLDVTGVRVLDAFVFGNQDAVGTITIQQKNTDITLGIIKPGENQIYIGVDTIPRNITGYLMDWSIGNRKAKNAEGRLWIREEGGVWRLRDSIDCFEAFNTKEYKGGLKLPPKTDIDFRGKSDVTNNNETILSYTLLWVDDTKTQEYKSTLRVAA